MLVVDDLVVHIEPKVPVENLFFMLSSAYDLPTFRDQESNLTASRAIFPFIVEIFRQQVDRLVRHGIYQRYVAKDDAQPFLRGRLNMVHQLRQQPAVAERFYQRLTEYTTDLLENQLLKLTLWRLSRVPSLDSQLRRSFRRTLTDFSTVSLLPLSAADCDHVHFNRLKARYHSPIQLAKLLLQNLTVEG